MDILLTEEMRTQNPAGAALLRAFAAVQQGASATLQQCLAVPGINVNERLLDFDSDWGSSYDLLYLAVLNRHTDCVRMLLAQPGINPNAGSGLSSPLHIAVSINNPEMVQLLLACRGIDVNARSSMGYHGYRTALHNAAADGKTAIVSLLLAAPGVDVTAKVKAAPLHLTLQKNTAMANVLRLYVISRKRTSPNSEM